MRKIIESGFYLLTIIFCSSQHQSCYAIDPTSRWKINITNDTRSNILETYIYFIDHDTIINSVTFYKLYRSGVFYFTNPYYYYSHAYIGAIRDFENRFYFIRKEETLEKLLIDFNLKLGDTIHSIIGKDRIVNLLDTLNDGRKRFGSIPFICGGCCPTPVLIEGIGHTDGLIEDPSCNHPGYNNNILICYSENGNTIYQNENNTGNNCDLSVSVPGKPVNDTKLKIYPVPAKNTITVETPENQDCFRVEIYDLQGSIKYSKNIRITNGKKTNIDISALNDGIYVITVSFSNSSYTQKLVKQ
jgi:hypothetical protein